MSSESAAHNNFTISHNSSSDNNIKVKHWKKLHILSEEYQSSYINWECAFMCMSVCACDAAAAVWQWNTARWTGWIIPNTIKGSSTRELRPWQRHIQRISQPVSYPLGTAEAGEKRERNGEMGENDRRRAGKRADRENCRRESKVVKSKNVEGRCWLCGR